MRRPTRDLKGMSRLGVLLTVGGVLVIAAAVVIPLELTGKNNGTNTSGTTARTLANCSSSGCAVVNTLHTTPRVTVFYGASCAGVRGAWFLNIAEEGPTGSPHPSYSLRWTFTGNSNTARPSGTVTVAPGNDSGVTMTLQQGVLALKGTAADGTSVNGVGSLTVTLGGSSSNPTLTLAESGLTSAESALGLVSPFNIGGAPTTVPVKTQSQFRGC